MYAISLIVLNFIIVYCLVLAEKLIQWQVILWLNHKKLPCYWGTLSQMVNVCQLLFCNFKVCNYIEIFTGVKSVTAPVSLIQKNKRVNTNWFIYPWYIFSLSLYLHFSDPRSLSAPREAQLNLSAEISVRI